MVVSPYHLTSRQAPAMAALLLGESVITMLPAPAGEVSQARLSSVAAAAPRYLRFMDSWRWSRAAWEQGIITSLHNGCDIADDVRAIWSDIASDHALAELRPFMRTDLFDDEHHYIDAVAGDLLKGGPDPAISVPVSAGLDRFAATHGLIVARSHPVSMAQKAETSLATAGFAVAIPILLQAGGERIIFARELLADCLADLRDAFSMEWLALIESPNEPGAPRRSASPRLRDAARAYSQAFEDHEKDLLSEQSDDEPRVVIGTVMLEAQVLPADAVLASSCAAVRGMAVGARSVAPDHRATLPVHIKATRLRPLQSIVVKPLGSPSRR
ncbi:MAG: hypothetical protein KGS45_06305 [Planctomycetes bacterium]|nr:hypothetical protein [Planctomycetota bacterium]